MPERFITLPLGAMVETSESNLWQSMRQLNGDYTQRFIKVHSRTGHVFIGRYKAILVQNMKANLVNFRGTLY